MATEIDRKKIGSLFGGEIMTLNYNFQAGSESSSCTLTLISENNEFLEPKMNETVILPPFGLPMNVLQTSIRKDPNYKVLQVELVDSLSDILDKELVFIYGKHTDLFYNLDNKGYYTYKHFAISKEDQLYLNINPLIDWPEMSRNKIKNYGDGINVIGFSRLTLTNKRPANLNFDVGVDLSEDLGLTEFGGHNWVVYDAGILQPDLCQEPLVDRDGLNFNITLGTPEGESQYQPEDGNLRFGYTLKILRDLIISKGILFEEKSFDLLSDDKVLFSDSGTLRSVLTNTLGKVGKSFYIDPLSQKINIISNSEVASINNNLNQKYLNFENTDTAEQLNLTKSIKDVSATHTVVKGALEPPSDDTGAGGSEGGGFGGLKRQPSIHRLFKLDGSKLVGDLLDQQDLYLMQVVAPFYFQTRDADTTNRYIFALGAVSNGTDRWGELYGESEYKYSEENLLEKDKGFWYEDLNSDDRYNFFDFVPEASEQAIRLVSEDGKNAVSAGQTGYFDFIENVITLWGGVYFGSPLTESRLSRRNYLNTFTGKGQYSIGFAQGDEYIADVSELSFLNELIRAWSIKTGNRMRDYKVKDLARRAGVGSSSNEFYPIAVRNMDFFSDGIPNNQDFSELINSNFYLFSSPLGKFLAMQNSSSIGIAKSISRLCRNAFLSKGGQTKSSIGAKFERVKNNKSAEGGGEEDDGTLLGEETPELHSINCQKSKTKMFSTRSLNEFSAGFAETELFLSNIEQLNPEFSGPFISTNVKYYRPPQKDDFDIGSGVSSVSIANGQDGVSTSVTYSSRKFAQIDSALVKEFLGAKTNTFFKEARQPAWQKNKSGN